ncbi:hypothetical protein RSAG8_13988, partial [Rhizoctonia solani AG-8 WAC10335]
MLKEIQDRIPHPIQHRIQTQEEIRLAEPGDASNRKCDLPVLAGTPSADSTPMTVTSIPESYFMVIRGFITLQKCRNRLRTNRTNFIRQD